MVLWSTNFVVGPPKTTRSPSILGVGGGNVSPSNPSTPCETSDVIRIASTAREHIIVPQFVRVVAHQNSKFWNTKTTRSPSILGVGGCNDAPSTRLTPCETSDVSRITSTDRERIVVAQFVGAVAHQRKFQPVSGTCGPLGLLKPAYRVKNTVRG